MKKIRFSRMNIKRTYSPIVYLPLLILWIFVLSGSLPLSLNIASNILNDDNNASNNSNSNNIIDKTESNSIEIVIGSNNETDNIVINPEQAENGNGFISLPNYDFYSYILIVTFTFIFSLVIVYVANTRPINLHEFELQTDLPFKSKKKNNGEDKLVLNSSIGEFILEWSNTKGLLRFWKMKLIFEVSNSIYDENNDQIKEITEVLFMMKTEEDQNQDYIRFQREFRVMFWPKIELQLKYWLFVLKTST